MTVSVYAPGPLGIVTLKCKTALNTIPFFSTVHSKNFFLYFTFTLAPSQTSVSFTTIFRGMAEKDLSSSSHSTANHNSAKFIVVSYNYNNYANPPSPVSEGPLFFDLVVLGSLSPLEHYYSESCNLIGQLEVN